jgi:hypothetical protein
MTVARPRGIHTRFPILPSWGTQTLDYKDPFNETRGHYHEPAATVNGQAVFVLFVLFCGFQ